MISYSLIEEIAYRDGANAMRKTCLLDVYYPTGVEDFATVVWFHGGGFRNEMSGGLRGREEPYVMTGSTLAGDSSKFGTYSHITSARFPYDMAWGNLAYEYGSDRDQALGLFIDGHAETIDREEAVAELDPVLRDFSSLD